MQQSHRFIEKHKDEYYFVLNKCSNGRYEKDAANYNIDFFLQFMIKVIVIKKYLWKKIIKFE